MAVMVDPCLTVGEGVRLLADRGERERSRKSRRGPVCSRSWHSRRTGCDRGQAEDAALRFTHMRVDEMRTLPAHALMHSCA